MSPSLQLPWTVEDPRLQENFDRIALQWPATQVQTTLTFSNGWAAQAGFVTPKAFRYGDMVTINGVFNAAAATNVIAFTLPAGYRPTATVAGPLNYWSGAARIMGTIYVLSTGVASMYGNADLLVNLGYFTVALTFSVNA